MQASSSQQQQQERSKGLSAVYALKRVATSFGSSSNNSNNNNSTEEGDRNVLKRDLEKATTSQESLIDPLEQATLPPDYIDPSINSATAKRGVEQYQKFTDPQQTRNRFAIFRSRSVTSSAVKPASAVTTTSTKMAAMYPPAQQQQGGGHPPPGAIPPPPGTAGAAVPESYFTESRKGEVNELRTLLRNFSTERDPQRKRDIIKKVIAYMTLGIDVSRLFTEMMLAIETRDLVIKKMVYLFLCNYATTHPELAQMCTNTLVKVRAMCD